VANFMEDGDEFTVSDNVVKHVFRRHRDWVNMISLKSVEDVRTFMMDVLRRPDIFHDNMRYFLRKVGGD